MTAAGAYVDEATLIEREFWDQLPARLSIKGAKLFATTNPDSPSHWLKKEFLDRAHELDLKHWHFTLDDNVALDPAYVSALKKEYTGLWYRRFILGQWVMADGAIYDMFDPDRHVVDELDHLRRAVPLQDHPATEIHLQKSRSYSTGAGRSATGRRAWPGCRRRCCRSITPCSGRRSLLGGPAWSGRTAFSRTPRR
jgi:hypothetical protein